MENRERLTFLRVILAGITLLCGIALYQFARPFYLSGILFTSLKWLSVSSLGVLTILLGLGLLVASWTSGWEKITRWAEAGFRLLKRLRYANLLLFGLGIALFAYLVLGRYGDYLEGLPERLAMFCLLALGGSILLKAAGFENGWGELFGASLVIAASGYLIANYFQDITTYPFSMGWSEASRFYYASLFFSQKIYGIDVPPSVLHPSRYLMQAIPYLIPDSPLWFHRLWQVFLWVAVTLVTAVALTRRLSIPNRLRRWILIAWAFLFILLGPVYYHLQIPVIVVLLFFQGGKDHTSRGFWKSLAVVLIASAWAGISRINWFPVPGMLAAALYFFDRPVSGQSIWKYLSRPFLWMIAGTGAAFGAQALYTIWSGNPLEQFTSSFSSDLLWNRLLPNPTYPLGILPASLLVSLPLLILICGRLAGRWKVFHPIRLLGLGAILLILFAGGLVVSAKIGGGSNLHNLDAYLTLLMVMTAYFFFNQAVEEPGEMPAISRPSWASHPVIIAVVLLLPFYSAISPGGPITYPTPEGTAQDLEILKRYVNRTVAESGEILFISERQLITFSTVKGVRLIPEYEVVFLMEMAMARNQSYLDKFRRDLADKRFALIVSEPLFVQLKGSEERFGEENDAWVEQVSKPILCYYQSEKMLRNVRVQLLEPREGSGNCK